MTDMLEIPAEDLYDEEYRRLELETSKKGDNLNNDTAPRDIRSDGTVVRLTVYKKWLGSIYLTLFGNDDPIGTPRLTANMGLAEAEAVAKGILRLVEQNRAEHERRQSL